MRLAVRLVLEMIGLGSARWGIDAPSADRCQQRVDYRVIYDVLDTELTVTVVWTAHRCEVYR